VILNGAKIQQNKVMSYKKETNEERRKGVQSLCANDYFSMLVLTETTSDLTAETA
jgi:hypothetical protein